MRVSIMMLALLGGCIGTCSETIAKEAQFTTEMAPLIGEYEAIELATLPRAELAIAKGRLAIAFQDGKLTAFHITPFGIGEGYAKTRSEVGIVVVERSTRDPVATLTYRGLGKGYGGWVTEAVIAHPEKRLLFMERSWCPPPELSGIESDDRGPSCGSRTSDLVGAVRDGREPTVRRSTSTFNTLVRKKIAAVAADPAGASRSVLEAYVDFESKTDNVDTETLAKLQAALTKAE